MQHLRQKIAGLDCILACGSAIDTPDAVAIICHGFGAPGTDLVPVGNEIIRNSPQLSNCLFIFPTAPIGLDPFFDSRAWWHIDMEALQRCMQTGEFREMRESKPDGLAECSELISQVIEHAMETYGLPASKIVLGGFSQGAMLTTNVAMTYPEHLGGLIIWSGTLLNETEWRVAAENQQPLDIAQSHGKLDPILPFFGAEALRDLFKQFGHNIEYVEFMGQHEIPPGAIGIAGELLKRVVAEA